MSKINVADFYFGMTVARYIHHNPVKASIVEKAKNIHGAVTGDTLKHIVANIPTLIQDGS